MDVVHTRGDRFRSSGFSLVELLVVVGIMILLAAMTVPSIQGILGSTGRKSAVNSLLNTFEQARAAALESGTNTYVGFADRNFPLESLRYRAFIVFRDRTEDDSPAAGTTGATQFVPLTAWETLPRNVSIKWQDGIVNVAGFSLAVDASLPKLSASTVLPVLQFAPSGVIANGQGVAPQQMTLFLYEGFYANGQDNFTRQSAFQRSSAGLFERISFSRYTGRARLDVTTTQ